MWRDNVIFGLNERVPCPQLSSVAYVLINQYLLCVIWMGCRWFVETLSTGQSLGQASGHLPAIWSIIPCRYALQPLVYLNNKGQWLCASGVSSEAGCVWHAPCDPVLAVFTRPLTSRKPSCPTLSISHLYHHTWTYLNDILLTCGRGSLRVRISPYYRASWLADWTNSVGVTRSRICGILLGTRCVNHVLLSVECGSMEHKEKQYVGYYSAEEDWDVHTLELVNSHLEQYLRMVGVFIWDTPAYLHTGLTGL